MVTPDKANREIEQAENATQFDRLSPTAKVRVNRLCDRFELLWQKESFADLEEFAAELTPEERESTIQELVEIDLVYRHRHGFLIELKSYLTRFESLNEKWLAERIQSITAADREKDAASIQLVPQQRLGDYTILGPLGAGGMGLVYRAEHRLMGRQVAIKILKASHTSDAASKLRFEREVRTLSKLSHPHIVVAYDAREQDGTMFLVIELIDGEDLASLVKRKGPLKPRDAMYYGWQAAKGLQYAHEQGIIHRDVKPSEAVLASLRDANLIETHTGDGAALTPARSINPFGILHTCPEEEH